MKYAILKSKRPLPWGLVLVLACWTGLTTAQSPDLGYVFPPFVERGKSTEVALGGYDFTPDMQFLVHGDEIALETDGGVGRFLHANGYRLLCLRLDSLNFDNDISVTHA